MSSIDLNQDVRKVNYKEQLHQAVYDVKTAKPKYYIVAAGLFILVILVFVAIYMMKNTPTVHFAEDYSCCDCDDEKKKKKKKM
jgi:hypothetical protein